MPRRVGEWGRSISEKVYQSQLKKVPSGKTKKRLKNIQDDSKYLKECSDIAQDVMRDVLEDAGYKASCYFEPLGIQGRKFSINMRLDIKCLRYKTVAELETCPSYVSHWGWKNRPDDYRVLYEHYDNTRYMPISVKLSQGFDFYKHDFAIRLALAAENFHLDMRTSGRYPLKKKKPNRMIIK